MLTPLILLTLLIPLGLLTLTSQTSPNKTPVFPLTLQTLLTVIGWTALVEMVVVIWLMSLNVGMYAVISLLTLRIVRKLLTPQTLLTLLTLLILLTALSLPTL
jgi:hypothetical protein